MLDDPLGQSGPGLVLIHHDSLHEQVGIVILSDLGDVFQQLVERLARELVAIEGDQAGLGTDQG